MSDNVSDRSIRDDLPVIDEFQEATQHRCVLFWLKILNDKIFTLDLTRVYLSQV